LGVLATAVVAASEPRERKDLENSLREAIHASRLEGAATSPLVDSDKSKSRDRGLVETAEAHRERAAQSAETLLALYQRKSPESPSKAEARPLVQSIIADENASSRAHADAMQAVADLVADRIHRMETFEYTLFALIATVLILEGLYVVNPAVKKIEEIMRDMTRSHAELKTYARKLERSNKELQDFASVASHDLQEPLRKIQAFSDRLRSRCASAVDDQGREYLDRIQNAASRMQTLINDLLTYARVATKAQPFVPTDLVSVTREVVSDLEARIEQVNGRVEVGDLPTLEADPLQVRQLMQNLIGNSLKYNRPDVPPVVSIYSHHLTRTDSAKEGEAAGEYCEISVEDNGIGFDEIYSEKIFTIFQRLHGRTEYEGTGVGLAVCRKIVERHGGTITARSTPGKGSTFTVTLPVRQPTEQKSDEPKS
jgi:signal transduction histidine kinase